jgi:serine/threonine-protein kinase
VSQKLEYFGKYLLLEKLATGGMAEVYLARSSGAIGITKFFAIKRILPQFSESPEFIEMFKDEAKIAINLSHSNIVSIYEFGVEKGQFFLAMDYVEGKNLRQILNKMKNTKANLNIDQIVYIAKEVASGLDHAHRCLDGTTGRPLNITHRDMSPQNIMVSFEGEVKIVDFGIAKAESQLETTKAGTLKGKFGYMSPEQAEGLSVDLRTDIFSLGIVLWELLANDRLFIANNEVNTLRKIRESNIPSLRKINPSIPPDLEKIVTKALTKDRNLRYQTASAFHKDLNRFLNRQYPDFSPQDFSIFCKTLFASEILENRKRLIEYAKIPATGDVDKDTEITSTLTDPDSRHLLNNADGSAADIRFNDTNSAFDALKKGAVAAVDLNRLKINDKGVFRPTPANTSAHTVEIQDSSNSGRPPRPRPKPGAARIFANPIAMAVATIFVAGGYFVWQRSPMLRDLQARLRSANPAQLASVTQSSRAPHLDSPTATPAPKAPLTAAAAEAKYTILVTSSPAAAEISLNGLSTGVLTPGTIQVDAQKTFTITLRADGYLNYDRSLAATQNPMRVQATLQKARLGYLDINVMPAGSVVYINGQALTEHPPIRRYAVQADAEIVIRAENPLTGANDELKVSVEQDKIKRVNLFPKTRGKGATRATSSTRN